MLFRSILSAVPGSVLWLPDASVPVCANLRREAKTRGVAPERLIFAPKLPSNADHLARLRCGDLFLDTLPYNAHTTASDALWAGLPVLTCRGKTFAGRVAASLLGAVGLPELIADSLEDYQKQAVALANDPARLTEIGNKLARNRETHPLFDTARFTRNLERAFETMWRRGLAGQPPETFSVEVD